MKIFIGIELNKEMLFHLKQSEKWKEAETLGFDAFQLATKNNKTFFGLFMPPLQDASSLKEKELLVKNQLHLYCPKLNLDRHSSNIFCQVLVV